MIFNASETVSGSSDDATRIIPIMVTAASTYIDIPNVSELPAMVIIDNTYGSGGSE